VFYALLLGPQLVRCDLRADLLNADLLKSYPLRGWQIVLGELLTPVAILTGIVWLSILAFALAQQPLPRPPGAIAVLALVAPAVCTLQLLMPNGMAVFLPAWSQSVRTEQGLDVVGQRLIFLILQVLITFLLALPAAIGAAGVWLVVSLLMSPHAPAMSPDLPPGWAREPASLLTAGWVPGLAAGVTALGVMVIELGFVIGWLGRRFERLDISAELRT